MKLLGYITVCVLSIFLFQKKGFCEEKTLEKTQDLKTSNLPIEMNEEDNKIKAKVENNTMTKEDPLEYEKRMKKNKELEELKAYEKEKDEYLKKYK